MRKTAALALAGLTLAGTVALTGCDPGPPCEQWSSTMEVVPVFNGKTTTVQLVPVTTCVKYGPEPTKHGS